MIVGTTVSKDGAIIQRWPVSVKVAIGLAPSGTKNYPEKLDHFVFLERGHQRAEWIISDRLMKIFAPDCKHKEVSESCNECCRSIKILLLSDDIDDLFPNEVAWWRRSGKFCHGDGEQAERRTDTGAFQKWDGPCKNNGCNDWERGDCKGSGDLRFMLPKADFEIARIHTTSLTSIANINSGLLLARNWASRLSGVCVPLSVNMAPVSYEQKGERKTSVAPILSIVPNPRQLAEDIKSTSALFDSAKAAFGKSMIVVEDDDERAPEIEKEFHPPKELPPAESETAAEPVKPEPPKQEAKPEPKAEPPKEEPKKPSEPKPKARVVLHGFIQSVDSKSAKGRSWHEVVLVTQPPEGKQVKTKILLLRWRGTPEKLLEGLESAKKQAEREVSLTCDIYDSPTKKDDQQMVAMEFAFKASQPEAPMDSAEGSYDWMLT